MSYCRHSFSSFFPKSQVKKTTFQLIAINLLESFQIKALASKKEIYNEKKRWLCHKHTNRITYCGKTRLPVCLKTQLMDKVLFIPLSDARSVHGEDF